MLFPFKRFTPFLYLRTLVFGVVVLMLFSSWANAPGYAALFGGAGRGGFNNAVGQHRLSTNGKVLNYRSAAGYAYVDDGSGHPAKLFYTDYVAKGNNRPVTFVFNGGPGSSSIWLHMGSFGPVRAVTDKKGYQSNPDTWLGFTDLVFIDPVGTGFSRAAQRAEEKYFYGYREDIRTIGQFIYKYLVDNNRQNSPLYLAGESYGAARAVGLTAYLQDTLQIPVKGLTLISPALDYRLITFNKGNDAPYPYYLASYAAAAWYHHRLAPELQHLTPDELNHSVTDFAMGAYRKALNGHQKLSPGLIDTLSYYIGVDSKVLTRLNGRITDRQFTSLLLKQRSEVTGTYDSRIAGIVSAADPSEMRLRASFPEAFRQYLHNNLHYENDLPYLVTIATPNWNYGPSIANGYLNVIPLLKNLLNNSADLKVHVVSGEYDLATPSATIDRMGEQLGSGRVALHHYAAGHMLYTDNQANTQWYKDSRSFYQNAE